MEYLVTGTVHVEIMGDYLLMAGSDNINRIMLLRKVIGG